MKRPRRGRLQGEIKALSPLAATPLKTIVCRNRPPR